MAFNGSGTFLRAMNWVSDAASGVKIRADRHDTEDDNFAAGLSNVITKDGQTTVTQNIPFNSKRLINVADPVNAQDAATKAWIDANVVGGALIADTPPAAGKVGNLWWDSDSGNLFLRYDDSSSTQWVQVNVSNPVADEKLVSVSADMAAMFKVGTANQFVINDKPDGSGTNVATISDLGEAVFGGRVNFSDYIVSTTASAVLAATGTGSIYLRPNGAASATGQTTISSNGVINCGGNISAPGFEAGHFNSAANTGIVVKANYTCKNGISVSGGGYAATMFNLLWNSAAMVLFVDNTNLGTINTTSDYRIKKDVVELPSTWDQVKALRPISYTQAEFTPPMSPETEAALPDEPEARPPPGPLFTEDSFERWGFIAHETQETLVMAAASGHKDMEDGVQGLQWAPILAATVRALQEAMARIEALEAR